MLNYRAGPVAESPKQDVYIPWCALVSFVVMSVFLLGCAVTPKHPSWNESTGPGGFERLMWNAIHKKDWKEFEYHLAPEFVGVNGSGQALDRTAWVEYWQNAQIQEIQIGEVNVRPESADMVVTCVLQLSGSVPGQPSRMQSYRVVSVWQQLKRGWALTTTSLTPILPS